MTKKRTILRFIAGIFIIMISFSCSRSSKVKFYSLDNDNCVTVISKDTLRYVIAGDYDKVPDTNFVKLDITKVTELGDGVWIRWLENQGWDIVVDKSIIIENKLDTTRYLFDNQLPVDERGIPTEIKFRQENCAIFDYYLMKLSPDKGAIVEIN